ncbi:MAG: hypothetical protein IKL87_05120 [Oscillospiraceae bacterium]|nr:hypothetical protein [Oscillospiraceae bacterium]
MNFKKLMIAAAVSLAAMTVLAGCEEVPGGADTAQTSPVATTPTSADDTAASDQNGAATENQSGAPSFSYTTTGGIELVINAECDPLVAQLGEPSQTFEAPSCAFEGTSYTYTYDGFTVETYPDQGVNRVYAVTLTDAAAKTKEGVAVGASVADVTAACGAADVESDAFLVYNGEGVDLQFFLEDGTVSSIVYTYHVG